MSDRFMANISLFSICCTFLLCFIHVLRVSVYSYFEFLYLSVMQNRWLCRRNKMLWIYPTTKWMNSYPYAIYSVTVVIRAPVWNCLLSHCSTFLLNICTKLLGKKPQQIICVSHWGHVLHWSIENLEEIGIICSACNPGVGNWWQIYLKILIEFWPGHNS